MEWWWVTRSRVPRCLAGLLSADSAHLRISMPRRAPQGLLYCHWYLQGLQHPHRHLQLLKSPNCSSHLCIVWLHQLLKDFVISMASSRYRLLQAPRLASLSPWSPIIADFFPVLWLLSQASRPPDSCRYQDTSPLTLPGPNSAAGELHPAQPTQLGQTVLKWVVRCGAMSLS